MFGFYGTCTYTRWKREASQCRLLKKQLKFVRCFLQDLM